MKSKLIFAVLLLAPALVSAQDAATRAADQASAFVDKLNTVILFPTIALLSGIAMLVFIFGCFQYIALSGNDEARQKGVSHITWGIVGLVVMLSAYAILSIAAGTFGLGENLRCADDPSGAGCVDVMAPPSVPTPTPPGTPVLPGGTPPGVPVVPAPTPPGA